MKKLIFLIFLISILYGCDVTEGCEKGTSAIGSKIHSNNLNWEEHFDVTYEELKLKHEGTYQTESEVWYKGDYKILTFYVKLDEKQEVSYQIGECGDMFWVGTITQTNDGVLYRGDCNKTYINTDIDAQSGGLKLANSSCFSSTPDGYDDYIPIKKTSNEIPIELNWEYTKCNVTVMGICE